MAKEEGKCCAPELMQFFGVIKKGFKGVVGVRIMDDKSVISRI